MYRYTEVVYIPNIVEDSSIVIGVLLWQAAGALVGVSKRRNWAAVTQLDPAADIEFLSATVDYLADQFRQANDEERQRLIDQMAMNLSLSDPVDLETEDPAKAIERLAGARGL